MKKENERDKRWKKNRVNKNEEKFKKMKEKEKKEIRLSGTICITSLHLLLFYLVQNTADIDFPY